MVHISGDVLNQSVKDFIKCNEATINQNIGFVIKNLHYYKKSKTCEFQYKFKLYQLMDAYQAIIKRQGKIIVLQRHCPLFNVIAQCLKMANIKPEWQHYRFRDYWNWSESHRPCFRALQSELRKKSPIVKTLRQMIQKHKREAALARYTANRDVVTPPSSDSEDNE